MLIPFTPEESINMVLRRLYEWPISKAIMYLEEFKNKETRVATFYYKNFNIKSENFYPFPPFIAKEDLTFEPTKSKLHLIATCMMLEWLYKPFMKEEDAETQDLEYKLNEEMFESKIKAGDAISLVHGQKPLNNVPLEVTNMYVIHPDYPIGSSVPCCNNCFYIVRKAYKICEEVYYTPLKERSQYKQLGEGFLRGDEVINNNKDALIYRFTNIPLPEGVTLDFQRNFGGE